MYVFVHISTTTHVNCDYIVRIDVSTSRHHNGMRLVRIASIFVKLRTYPYGKSHSLPASVTAVANFEKPRTGLSFLPSVQYKESTPDETSRQPRVPCDVVLDLRFDTGVATIGHSTGEIWQFQVY